ncbi:PAS domain-containing protein [Flavobacterium algicola]|uniref:PAS domain-containing protein n=1 Tax=Flavobacterium algicola TaxID=556529 RepID=UPI001EFD9CE2|nr:PAS domain-containing protein [Flavobacterium algicola]MCG9791189.1 PAS domain-containing protein [Flavobacterium algicola]
MDSKKDVPYFLRNGGEMGELIRAKDWSTTPLGEPHLWPQSLQVMVSVMLENPFGMYIVWGKEYTQLYNDGYRPILGSTKHPHALGISSMDTFPEIWDTTVGPMFEDAMKGKPISFTDLLLPLDRNGYLENCYFTFSYSAIRLENGEIGGVLVTVIETTNKKLAEDELQESKNQLEFTIEAAQLGTFDFNPISNKFTANNRLKEWFGLAADKELEIADALNVLSDHDKDRVSAAILSALQDTSDGTYDIEYQITNPISKNQIIVHAKGKTWFDENRVAYRLNGTVEDITERVKAQQINAQREKINRQMVAEAPIGICVIDAETLVAEIVNDNFVTVAGKPYSTIFGNRYWDVFPEAELIYREALEKVIATGIPYFAHDVNMILLRHGKEERLYLSLVYAPVKDEDGKIIKVAIWVTDNTTKEEARIKILESENNLKLMILQAPVGIAILRGEDYKVEIVNKLGLEIWGRSEEQIVNKSIFNSMPELRNQGIKELLDNVVNTGNRFEATELPLTLQRNDFLEQLYINFSYEPLYGADGKVSGIMAIGYDVTQQFLARKKVEENEQSIRAIVESAPFPIAVYENRELRVTIANQSMIDAWGKGPDMIGKLYTEINPEFENQQIFEQVLKVFDTGIAFHAKNQRVDLVMDNQLQTFYYNYSFTPVLDPSGNIYGVMNTAADVTPLHEAKQKVEESEKRFRDSVEQAPLGIAIFRGPDFIVEMANDNYLLLVDRKEHEFVGVRLFDAIPEVINLVQPLFDEVIRSGEAFFSPELPVVLKRKGVMDQCYFNLVYHPLKEENGEISGIMVVATEVTSTVIAKHVLEESEKHFRSMMMQSPIPMTIFHGKDHIINSANAAMFNNIWRKKESDVIGKTVIDVFPELKEQKYLDLLDKVFTTGERHTEYESVAYVLGDDGMREFYLDFEYKPLLGPDDEIRGIMVTANDITDKVDARKKIEENEEKLNIVIDASELGIWEINLETEQTITSKRCREIFGINGEEDIAHNDFLKYIHPDDVSIRNNAFKQAFETGILRYEVRVIWADGTIHWVETKGKVFYNVDNIHNRILGTVREITEEKQFQQLLLEREEKFRLLADSMPQYVWTSGPDGVLNYFNQSVYDFSGLSFEQISELGWMEIVHPDDRKTNMKKWLQSIKTGEDFLLEHRFRKHDGEYRWQLSRAVPRRNESGEITMWVGTSTDIQDQKMFTYELEKQVRERTKELNEKNTDLEKMNKELQSFAYISSHDLQEPLRKIQTFASLINEKEYKNLSDAGKDKFSRMQKAAYRMQTLIQDLLAYSRTNTQERIFEEHNLRNIVDEVKSDLTEELISKNASIELGEMIDVKIIPFQFRQLLFNLFSNALKFTIEDNDPVITITSQIAKGADLDSNKLLNEITYCHIRFADNGIGFEQEYSEKIFVVFQRLHGKEEHKGTGIGLAIVKKIIDNHFGIIEASGELNKGAIFDIYLPF